MASRKGLSRQLAAAFLSSNWTPQAMEEAGLRVLGGVDAAGWLKPLVAEVRASSIAPYPPSPRQLARRILASDAIAEACKSLGGIPRYRDTVLTPPRMVPTPPFRELAVPRLATLGDLSAWLNVSLGELAWFADVGGWRARSGAASNHYCCHWVQRSRAPPRLIEAPKPLTKAIQRQILRGILDLVPVHPRAHGFVKGRSCLTAAERHAGEAVVVALDLKDFFARVPTGRVCGLFRCLGYPWAVARALTALCSTTTPAFVLFGPLPGAERPAWETLKRFEQPHLPQGAPTSPALANLVAWRLDGRLDGLARRLDARYSRYADDLAFSAGHDFARRCGGFIPLVGEICAEEGFVLNRRKSRIMGQGGPQRLTGLIVNQHVNVPRARYDRLKAILTNCVRDGPECQNRARHPHFRQHLDGQVTWVENVNPRRGHRLRLLFQRIDWLSKR